MKFGSLFAGIGGFDLGLERAGMECAWQVEIDEYCLKVLEKHWPDVPHYTDVRECGRDNLEPVDLICGGFPCQPYSYAGKRKGKADDRNLWPEFLRIIRELRPTWVITENVPGLVSLYIDTVLSDLESEAYTCQTFNIPALAFSAPHRRYRVFIIAYSEANSYYTDTNSIRSYRAKTNQTRQGSKVQSRNKQSHKFRQMGEIISNTSGEGLQKRNRNRSQSRKTQSTTIESNWWTVEPDVGRVAHGVPSRVDRLRGLGNAVVPQVAEFIGQRILEVEK